MLSDETFFVLFFFFFACLASLPHTCGVNCVGVRNVPYIFNDKISYKVTSFNDVRYLNEVMLPVATKFELFGISEKALQELEKFKTNFELLQTALGKL